MSVVLPPPLADAAAYQAEIQRLDEAITATAQQLGRLRRERGIRLLQLAEHQQDPKQ